MTLQPRRCGDRVGADGWTQGERGTVNAIATTAFPATALTSVGALGGGSGVTGFDRFN